MDSLIDVQFSVSALYAVSAMLTAEMLKAGEDDKHRYRYAADVIRLTTNLPPNVQTPTLDACRLAALHIMASRTSATQSSKVPHSAPQQQHKAVPIDGLPADPFAITSYPGFATAAIPDRPKLRQSKSMAMIAHQKEPLKAQPTPNCGSHDLRPRSPMLFTPRETNHGQRTCSKAPLTVSEVEEGHEGAEVAPRIKQRQSNRVLGGSYGFEVKPPVFPGQASSHQGPLLGHDPGLRSRVFNLAAVESDVQAGKPVTRSVRDYRRNLSQPSNELADVAGLMPPTFRAGTRPENQQSGVVHPNDGEPVVPSPQKYNMFTDDERYRLLPLFYKGNQPTEADLEDAVPTKSVKQIQVHFKTKRLQEEFRQYSMEREREETKG